MRRLSGPHNCIVVFFGKNLHGRPDKSGRKTGESFKQRSGRSTREVGPARAAEPAAFMQTAVSLRHRVPAHFAGTPDMGSCLSRDFPGYFYAVW